MQTELYAYVMGRLRSSNLSYREIAEGAGMSRRTVEKIARQEIADPGVSHIEKLAVFFRARR